MGTLLAILLTIVIGAFIGDIIALVCEWNDERVSSAEQAKEAESRRITTEALAVKQRLDAEAFSARKAMFQAAQRHSGDLDGR
jgi:hypothetical protein